MLTNIKRRNKARRGAIYLDPDEVRELRQRLNIKVVDDTEPARTDIAPGESRVKVAKSLRPSL